MTAILLTYIPQSFFPYRFRRPATYFPTDLFSLLSYSYKRNRNETQCEQVVTNRPKTHLRPAKELPTASVVGGLFMVVRLDKTTSLDDFHNHQGNQNQTETDQILSPGQGDQAKQRAQRSEHHKCHQRNRNQSCFV